MFVPNSCQAIKSVAVPIVTTYVELLEVMEQLSLAQVGTRDTQQLTR